MDTGVPQKRLKEVTRDEQDEDRYGKMKKAEETGGKNQGEDLEWSDKSC